MIKQLERIKQKLHTAEKQRPKCFGSGLEEHLRPASGHQWRSYPVSEAAIAEFETKYSITLPEEYRTFLIEVGVGAGPFYGLHNLSNWLCDDETEDGELNFLASPCLITPEMCEGRGFTEWDEKLEDSGVPEERVYQGILAIVSQGCTYLSGIIITGEHRGVILNLDLDRQVPQWTKLGFLDWYEAWLDRVLDGKRL